MSSRRVKRPTWRRSDDWICHLLILRIIHTPAASINIAESTRYSFQAICACFYSATNAEVLATATPGACLQLKTQAAQADTGSAAIRVWNVWGIDDYFSGVWNLSKSSFYKRISFVVDITPRARCNNENPEYLTKTVREIHVIAMWNSHNLYNLHPRKLRKLRVFHMAITWISRTVFVGQYLQNDAPSRAYLHGIALNLIREKMRDICKKV